MIYSWLLIFFDIICYDLYKLRCVDYSGSETKSVSRIVKLCYGIEARLIDYIWLSSRSFNHYWFVSIFHDIWVCVILKVAHCTSIFSGTSPFFLFCVTSDGLWSFFFRMIRFRLSRSWLCPPIKSYHLFRRFTGGHGICSLSFGSLWEPSSRSYISCGCSLSTNMEIIYNFIYSFPDISQTYWDQYSHKNSPFKAFYCLYTDLFHSLRLPTRTQSSRVMLCYALSQTDRRVGHPEIAWHRTMEEKGKFLG